MQKQPNDDARKVVPRWRELWRTPSAELRSSLALQQQLDFLARPEWSDAISNWRNHPSIFTSEQVAAIAVLGAVPQDSYSAIEALRTGSNVRPALRGIAESLIARGDVEKLNADDTNEDFRRKRIADLKRWISSHPRNAIACIELARLYSTNGQNDAARDYVLRALRIAPVNRYVVRSAARFFVHSKDPELALKILGRAERIDDPWILAAIVATADLAENTRAIPLKRVRGLLSSGLPPIQTSELNASMATLELGDGNTKRAKRLFKESAIDVTDNAAAQIAWAEQTHKISVPLDLDTVEFSFEANARQSYVNKNWEEFSYNAERWLLDEAFSSRPAVHGSFVTAEYLKDYERSLDFSLFGLRSNPNDIFLLNNAAYALSELGRLAEAKEKIERAKRYKSDDDGAVALLATEGHISFAIGDILLAEHLYEAALNKAIALKDRKTGEMVLIHWIKEELKHHTHLEDWDKIAAYFSESGAATSSSKDIFRALIEGPTHAEEGQKKIDIPLERIASLPAPGDEDTSIPNPEKVTL